MAGMFYSLQEAAAKINVPQARVTELVRKGRLREFRDGSNVLFKVEEIDALAIDQIITPDTDKQQQAVEPVQEENLELQQAETEQDTAETEDLFLLAEETSDDDLSGDETITLETPADSGPADAGMTDADTSVAGDKTVVVETKDTDSLSAADTFADTKENADEASLKEIEEDVNLDTFGSGSGLLDLSLQADDTSLGGILDDIYTSETPGGQPPAAASEAALAAEADQMLSDEDIVAPQAMAPAIAAYAETPADTQSNALGMLLFLPLLATVYTAIVTVASFRNVNPSVLGSMANIIWYIVIGAMVVTLGFVGATAMAGKPRTAKKPAKKKTAKKTTP